MLLDERKRISISRRNIVPDIEVNAVVYATATSQRPMSSGSLQVRVIAHSQMMFICKFSDPGREIGIVVRHLHGEVAAAKRLGRHKGIVELGIGIRISSGSLKA